jgi:cell division transport system permease protein
MKSLKSHFSVVVSLFALLLTIEFATMLNRLVSAYEAKLSNDYNILIVAYSSIDTKKIKNDIYDIKSIEPISAEKVLSRFKGSISKTNYELLKVTIPKFYSIKLRSIPSSDKLELIKERLKRDKNIKKVETFVKSYGRIYRFLVFIKSVSILFSGLTFLISSLLIFKQTEVWALEHSERMSVMGIFGAPFWMKSAVLYKMVIVDTIIAVLLNMAIFIYIPYSNSIKEFFSNTAVGLPEFDIVDDTLFLFSIGLGISIFAVTMVTIRHKGE